MNEKDFNRVKHSFGSIIKRERERIGISQEELGYRSGLHRTYVNNVECGARNVTLKTIYRLSLALGSSFTDLFEKVDELI